MKNLNDQSVDELQCIILTIWALKYGVEYINGKNCLKAKKFAKQLKEKRDNKKCNPIIVKSIIPA